MRDRRARLSIEHIEIVLFLKINSSFCNEHTLAEAIDNRDNFYKRALNQPTKAIVITGIIAAIVSLTIEINI